MAASFSPDYIIIGGGTAGLVVANHLSETPNVQVLVLEAGKDMSNDPRVNVPAFWTTLIDTGADWQYCSEPQLGLNGRAIPQPQGKALGGSSAINGQAFIAPARAEIDSWAKLGNPGWDWASLAPSFKKAYTLMPPPDQATRDHLGIDWIDDEYRGVSPTPGRSTTTGPENLQNHLMSGLSYEVIDGVVTGDPLLRQEPDALALAQKLYEEHKAGPFTIGGMQSHAFMPTPDAGALLDSLPRAQRPEDAEFYETVRAVIEDPNGNSAAWLMFLAQSNLHQNDASFVGTSLLPENYASLGCIQSHPFSRGSTHIASANPDDAPRIDPRHFSHPADLEIMARHLQALDTQLRYTKALSAFFKPDGKRNHPDAFQVADLEVAKRYLLDTATTSYHPCGTAAMLPREKGGVVDPKLVVYGTENVRVVDASVFPLIPRGNIMSSVYAVAEKAADIIKGQ